MKQSRVLIGGLFSVCMFFDIYTKMELKFGGGGVGPKSEWEGERIENN